jgi:hypothetical protein
MPQVAGFWRSIRGVPTLMSHVFRRLLERGYRKRRESYRLTVVVLAQGNPGFCVLSAPCLAQIG